MKHYYIGENKSIKPEFNQIINKNQTDEKKKKINEKLYIKNRRTKKTIYRILPDWI